MTFFTTSVSYGGFSRPCDDKAAVRKRVRTFCRPRCVALIEKKAFALPARVRDEHEETAAVSLITLFLTNDLIFNSDHGSHDVGSSRVKSAEVLALEEKAAPAGRRGPRPAGGGEEEDQGQEVGEHATTVSAQGPGRLFVHCLLLINKHSIHR